MPSISRRNVAAGTSNALNGLRHQTIRSPGALVSIYASTPTAGGTLTYGVDSEVFGNLIETNIETSADRVANSTDQVLFREPVPPGDQFLSVDTQIGNFLVVIEQLP
jgi:3-hydroxymyristoyl/3-hydroxydecanoyl-(acyl carrier protein) dehydratase